MAIDLYTGPLQRYFTRRWETPGEVAAREAGMKYKMVFPDGVDPLSLDDRTAIAEVRDFAERLKPDLHLVESPCWQESFDSPYLSVQLTPDGLKALIIWAAFQHRGDLERPKALPEDHYQVAAVAEASDKGYYMGAMSTLEAHMIVPGPESAIVMAEDPIGRELFVTTSAALDQTIEFLAPSLDLTSEKAQALVKSGAPSRGAVMRLADRRWYEFYKPKWIQEETPPLEDEVKALAEYALAAFMVTRDFAVAHRVPIVRDE
ncbi:MAG: hypothetical protein QNJ30_22900 [Kiloniellales bacterium]|nr:hypothetical protein [Kiloniellales bacterium]